MNKAIFRLSLCLFALGISDLSTQKVNANTLKDSSEVKSLSSGESSALIAESGNTAEESAVYSTSPTETIESEPVKETNQADDFNLPNLFTSSKLTTEKSAVSRTLPDGAVPRVTTVNSEDQLENALSYGGTIYIGRSFTVNSQLSYGSSFAIVGTGNQTLTFARTGGFFSGSGNGATITVQDLNLESSVSYISTGGTAVFSFSGTSTLNLNNVSYKAEAGCPLTSTDNVSESIAVNLSGDNNLEASGFGAPDTTLLKNISSVTVNDGTTTIMAGTPNSSGSEPGRESYSVIKFTSGQTHNLNIASGAKLSIQSSKNILFDVNGTLTMNVGNSAEFDYLSTGGNNQIFGSTGYAIPNNPFRINVEEASKTAFRTNGSAANFESGINVQVIASTPDYVQFKSESGETAIRSGSPVSFRNQADNSGRSGNYILSETPVGSSTEETKSVAVGRTVNLSSGNYQNIIYHKEKVEEVINLAANYRIGNNLSTIRSTLSGAYANYDDFEWLASPEKLTDDEITAASIAAQNDASGHSGYYQSGSIPTNGILPNVTNVWANEYYLYTQLSNSSTGKTSAFIECVVSVPEYTFIRPSGAINFVGGYRLSAISNAKLTNEGNTECILQYNNFTVNAGSSEEVSLVASPTTGNKELVLNLTAKNNNSSPSWGPLMLNSNGVFNGQVNLLPYWTGSGNSDANFTVNGSYSGPLGKNQLENVSYNLSMNVYTNN